MIQIKDLPRTKEISNDKLIFLKAISNVIKSGMNIIGVNVPEKVMFKKTKYFIYFILILLFIFLNLKLFSDSIKIPDHIII